MGRTDRLTNWGATLNAASYREGRVIS